ncbi:lantibiotic dehydratase [Streptomyces thermocoprophilus]|uniref:Lantibiotic dehydratase n=1 Tax=Streptomyces thermocoprophilus TaxID=78356 RepID=A0ABV5V9Z5_9ACTN
MNGFQENGSPRTATPARQGAFSPYYLYRRGTLGPAALDGLTPVRTWTLLAEAERTRQRREELRGRLEDALHTAVPALPADRRRELLRLRRDIHNDRVPGVPDAARLLDPATRELLEEWLRQRAEGHRLQKEAEAALAAELDDGRRTLAAVAAGELFQRGLQLSDERTWRTVTEWAADPFSPRRKPSKRRRAENTLTSFAYRVALKPSPFASFTEIGAAPWTTDAAVVPVDGPRARPVQARLSAGLLSWMTYELRRLDRADELMQIRLNHSLLVQGEKAMCVRRAPDGAPEAAYGAAQVVAARDTGLLRLLRSLLADGARPEREVRDRLTAAGLSPEAAATALDKLVRAGICERGLGIPDQHPRPALAVAQRLRALDTEQAGRCAVVFEQLQAAEDAFPAAPVRRRADLLAGMREQVAVFTDTVGCPAPAPEALRSVVYEDVGTRRPARTWRPEVLHANRWALELFQRIVPVLDDATVEKAGLYAFFVRHFGEDADAVPFVEFYRRFAALPPAEASAVASGVGDPHADRIRALRAGLAGLLRTQFHAHRASENDPHGELRLDADRLRGFAERLPAEIAPWRSTAYRVQFTTGPERPYAVVNGVTTGHGVFFSRFCDLLEPDAPHEWSLTEALRGHIARTTPRQCDITAVLGLNFNLHPRLSPLELVYPGSTARTADDTTLTLADLAVRAEPDRRTLTLVSTRDGRPLDLVPLNFLYPAAAPVLYRLLCAFAPTRTYRGGLWDQLDRADAVAGRAAGLTRVPAEPRTLPRALLGDLVLDRASWRLPAADVPGLEGLERQEAAALAAFGDWLGRQGIPRHTFFRLTTPPPVPAGQRDLLAETRQWALEARTARLHKPHYLDARNPFLLQVFARRLAEAGPDATVTFQECLPHPADLDDDPHTGAEEFFVEHTLALPAPTPARAPEEDPDARP